MGISGYVAAFGIAPTELQFWDSEVRGYRLGASSFFTGSSIPKLKEDEGFVLIFEGPFTFSIEMAVPLDRAREITSLSGKVVDLPPISWTRGYATAALASNSTGA